LVNTTKFSQIEKRLPVPRLKMQAATLVNSTKKNKV